MKAYLVIEFDVLSSRDLEHDKLAMERVAEEIVGCPVDNVLSFYSPSDLESYSGGQLHEEALAKEWSK